MIKKLGFFAVLASFFTMPHMRRGKTSNASGASKGLFNLSGLPPAWKGRRMRRIMRGGK